MEQQWQMMLNMFPEPWVRNFTNSGQNPSTVTVAAMLAYMNYQLIAEVINNERKRGFDGGQHGNNQNMHSGQNNNYYHHNRHEEAMAMVATIATTTMVGTPISVVGVVDMEMVVAMVIVCVLFNLMMNVKFTVDTSGTSVISTHDRILMPQRMVAVVAAVVMEHTDQQDSIMLLRMMNTILPKP
jgi:hypothetical protein